MMKLYAIKEMKSGGFTRFIPAKHVGEMLRAVTMMLRKKEGEMAEFPEDFSLWELAEINEVTGEIRAPGPAHIINFVDLLKGGVE